MERPRVFLLVVLLLFIYYTPDQPPRRFGIVDDTKRAADIRRQDFSILRNSSYGDLDIQKDKWLNLTGFRKNDRYLWELLPRAQELSRKQHQSEWLDHDLAEELLPIYDDFTGDLKGKFRQIQPPKNISGINLTETDPGKEYILTSFQRNISEIEGELTLSLNDSPKSELWARGVKADLTFLTRSSPGLGWQAAVQGVHMPSGSVILSTHSSKYNALPALPHFALDSANFQNSTEVMVRSVQKLWDENIDQISSSNFGTPSCELVLWLHPKPQSELWNSNRPSEYMQYVENELTRPQGAPIGSPPPLIFSAIIFSPDCGYILEVVTLLGVKAEVYRKLAQKLLFAFVLMEGMQIYLLKRQMQTTATPSTLSRIAYQSIAVASMGDGLILVMFIALLIVDEATFLTVATATFLSLIYVTFEVKFIFDIWTVQVGDPARLEHERQRRETATEARSASRTDGSEVDGLPLPATAPNTDGATPIVTSSDQDTENQLQYPSQQSSFAAIYSRFYFYLICLIFLSLWALSWPQAIRSAYVNMLTFIYLSLWIPQIRRNIMRNCRKALNWEYVVGTSILRGVPILYWYFDEANILSVHTGSGTAFLLIGWVSLQISILATQKILGPRLFVKESWCPPAYDYHPILKEDDVEAGGISIGRLGSASEAKDRDDKKRRVFDCAICMNEIDIPIISKNDGNRTTTWLEQKDYMITPCRHIFHSECLEGWMDLRLACPVCRESLPAL